MTLCLQLERDRNMDSNQQIRTEAVKTILTTGVKWDTIKACRDLTDSELEFVRVYLEMNTAPPRARRSDAGTKRVKPVAEISKAS